MRVHYFFVGLLVFCGVAKCQGQGAAAALGRLIFEDTNLSEPVGQGCISCHDPDLAFSDGRAVSPGAVEGRVGRRNAPSLMYAALIPPMAYEDILAPDGSKFYAWEGGMFHDGRAADLFEQVQVPFFDANEMNLADVPALAAKLRKAPYADRFQAWVGDENWQDDTRLTYHAWRALVEFLKAPLFRPFDARIDDFLAGDTNALSAAEQRGLVVFKEQGKCADCHFLIPDAWEEALLSDYGYDNVGVPTRGEKDSGLGGHTGNAEELGQFKAPSLRNIALTAPYMHNGSIATLKEVLEFYNKRDLEPARWGKTDYPETVNREDMGDLKMTDQQVADLLALMEAFTDRSLLNKQAGVFPEAPADIPSTESKRYYFPDWRYRLHPAFPGVLD